MANPFAAGGMLDRLPAPASYATVSMPIQIYLHDGTAHTQQAEVFNSQIALFKGKENFPMDAQKLREWNITHVRSGAAILRLDCRNYSKLVAIQVCQILCKADWNFGEFGCIRMLKDMPQDVKDSIQEVVDLLWPDNEDAPPSYKLKNQAIKKLTK